MQLKEEIVDSREHSDSLNERLRYLEKLILEKDDEIKVKDALIL